MKNFTKQLIILAAVNIFILLFAGSIVPNRGSYVIVGWNSLGMHCANKDFSKMCILPPYNDVYAQVVKVGDGYTKPQVVTKGVRVTYEIPGNTVSVNKTNFWVYVKQIFGVALSANIGLRGNGLSGKMVVQDGDHFIAEGIPLTPYQDADLAHESPFQLGLLKLYDSITGTFLAYTQPVIPVSNEISCLRSGCHKSENEILAKHPAAAGYDSTATPVFCASCHSDNALGTPGKPGVKSMSAVMHGRHGNVITTDCYACHPGPTTHCLRDTMAGRGFTCDHCHGAVADVASSIDTGRAPWLNEPSCYDEMDCHKIKYAPEEGKLMRFSRGHGGLFCSACHGSPHAIYPSRQPNDNVQNIVLQGFKGKLKKCSVCHGMVPDRPGPHLFLPSAIEPVNGNIPKETAILANYPNPFNTSTLIPFSIRETALVKLDIYCLKGQLVETIVYEEMNPGIYKVTLNGDNLKPGTYFALLRVGKTEFVQKIIYSGN